MTDALRDRPSRRSVLAGGGLLLLAACTGSPPVRPPQLSADQRLALRAAGEISVLAAAYAATIVAHPRAKRILAPLAAEHEAHAAALVALLPAPTATPTPPSGPTTSSSATTSPSPSPPPVAPSPATALAALGAAELAAAARRRGQAGDAGPELARLLASIAACESVHAAQVAP